MDLLTYDDQTFDKAVYTEQEIKGREFSNCLFKNSDFSGPTLPTANLLTVCSGAVIYRLLS